MFSSLWLSLHNEFSDERQQPLSRDDERAHRFAQAKGGRSPQQLRRHSGTNAFQSHKPPPVASAAAAARAAVETSPPPFSSKTAIHFDTHTHICDTYGIYILLVCPDSLPRLGVFPVLPSISRYLPVSQIKHGCFQIGTWFAVVVEFKYKV